MKKYIRLALAAGAALASLALFGCAQQETTATSADSTQAEAEQSSTQEESETPEETSASTGDPEKKAILVVSFGTSYADTRAVTLDAIEENIAQTFPDYDVKRAFTSQTIIDKLAERDGLEINNVTEAMEELAQEGYGTVICQPTHVMNGLEYDDMVAEVSAFANQFDTIKFGTPLLTSMEDYQQVAEILANQFPDLQDNEAVVLMGHGTTHYANAAYPALDYVLKEQGHDNYYVGTVESYPNLDTILPHLEENQYTKVYLVPLMITAGDHATNDMASDEEGSWKTELRKAGFEAEPILRGLGEYPEIQDMFAQHVQQAIDA